MTEPPPPPREFGHAPDRTGRPSRRQPPLLPRGPAPTARPRRRGRRGLAAVGYLALAAISAIVGAVTFLLVAAPVDFVRDQLVSQVKAHTGRDLSIAGPTSISLLPQVSVHLADVSLSEPPGMGGGAVLTAQTFAIDVPLLSLLSRQFAVKRLLLVRPTIDLRIDRDGQRNWAAVARGSLRQAASVAAAPAPDPAPPSGAPGAGRTRVAAAFDGLSLENVHISDGTVRYLDERTGQAKELSGINLDLSLADLAGPVHSKGSLTWNGEQVAFEGKLSPALSLVSEERGRAALSFRGRLIEAGYDGWLTLGKDLALEGKANLKAASLGALAHWLGKPVAIEAGGVDLSTAISLGSGRLALNDLNADVGGNATTGSLEVELDGARPHVSGQLRTTELDLGRLLLRRGATGTVAPAEAAAPSPQADTGQARAEPAGKAPAKHRGWSDAPIDLALLGLADADLTLLVDHVVYHDLKTDQGQLVVAVKDSIAKLTLNDLLLYGGRGRGSVSFDASGAVPATRADIVLDNVFCRPLLKDALGLEWLAGRGKVTLALAGQGRTERNIIETLQGTAELAIGNGEFAGLDVGKIMRAIEQAHFNRLEVSADDKTLFSELSGSFHVSNGVAESNDLKLIGPQVRVTGNGKTNLAERTADYLVHLKIAETAPSEGAVIRISGLEFPMRIVGPWDKLSFKPDIKGLGNSEQAGEALRQIGKNLNSPEVKEAVKGLLSGDGQQRVKPRELLEKLLKKP